MHVLFLPSWYSTIDKPWRGNFFHDQAIAIQRLGIRVGVAFVERRSLSKLTATALVDQHFQTSWGEEGGVPTIRMKGWSTFAQTSLGAMAWTMLMRRLVRSYVEKEGVPDLIHAHAAMWAGHAARICAADLQRPYVVTEHASSILTGRLKDRDRPRVREVYRDAASVVSVSRALKGSVDRIAGTDVAEVVPNAVDPAFFRLPPAPRRSSPFVFLAVGDLVSSKRMDLLLRAFARLRSRVPQAWLIIAGTGKESQRLAQWTHLLAIDDAVEFTGALTRAEVRARMWSANALVLPSDYETFGVVLIEALSTGLPVITTRCGGPEEIVTSRMGSLIDPGDENGLLQAMEEIVERPFDPLSLRESVARRFGFGVVGERLREIYERVATRRRKAA
jgi:glycosyltransferase involved in cell wall biosynthesis